MEKTKIRYARSGLKILKFFDADPDPGSAMEKFGSGIRDKHPGSATLVFVWIALTSSSFSNLKKPYVCM
jgi:hypothetical protein